MHTEHYVQYGCGFCAPKGWRNFDASPTLRIERIPIIGKFILKNEYRFPENVEFGDIVKGLPISNGSCKAVYCSHVLEHLALEDFRVALKNTYELLMRGGVFRLVLPDVEYHIKEYTIRDSPNAAPEFMKATSLGSEKKARGIKGCLYQWLGNSEHRWMWDYRFIEVELGNTGFKNVRRAEYGDSSVAMFSEVEDRSRWENCLGVECIK